ncbi:MAG: hypothetical protein MK089_00610 [Phycisphaerales bacterium]|nr:hypothetical protein [Phycisphaerales bacterium]
MNNSGNGHAVSARAVAYEALTKRVENYPELHRMVIERDGLSPRDARLALAIDHHVTMRWLTLVALIEPHLKHSWNGLKPVVRAAMLGGAAQILLMDRIPDHAVLHETVEWIKSGSQPRAAGMVNAVLRRLCELRGEHVEEADPTQRDMLLRSDGSGIRLTKPILSDDPAIQMQQQTSCPAVLLDHWISCFGQQEAYRLAMHGIADAPLIVSCEEKMPTMADPHEVPGFQVIHRGVSASEVLEAHPDAVIQDPASAEPVRATIGMEPRCILDLCAGRGTKTRLLARHHPASRIIAMDYDRSLHEDLSRSTSEYGNIEVRPFGQFEDLIDEVDLLVLDVPCSNTAVLARRPEARYRFSMESLEELAQRQRQIMADSILTLSPNGRILYATCSLDPAENNEQVQWLVRWHRMNVEHEHLMSPGGLPGDPAAAYHDGSYHALLSR